MARQRSSRSASTTGTATAFSRATKSGSTRAGPASRSTRKISATRTRITHSTSWTARGFTGLDHNRDNRIARDEWHFDPETFRRAYHNHDGSLSRAEFLGTDGTADDDRADHVRYLDANRDGRVTRDEWHGSPAQFDALDDNRDGLLSSREVAGEPPPDLFTSVDVDHNGSISLAEWHWSRASFDSRDTNHDSRLSRAEFDRSASQPDRSAAYRTGYDCGMIEGRAAGREDHDRNQGWDLEGQRELEGADSGYEARMDRGPTIRPAIAEAFRIGYREGFGR